jgi:DNA (cytosine-5)-methyltransferase 1
LRFIDDYKDFIKTYTQNLVEDSKKSTEIKESHITAWKRILEEYKL